MLAYLGASVQMENLLQGCRFFLLLALGLLTWFIRSRSGSLIWFTQNLQLRAFKKNTRLYVIQI